MSLLTTHARALTTRSLPRLAAYDVSRAFGATAATRKTAADTVKDTLKTVNRAVSDKLVDSIELGEAATEKAKEVTGVGAGEAKAKATELSGAASGKASELSGEAKGAAHEVAGKAKGVKEEARRKL